MVVCEGFFKELSHRNSVKFSCYFYVISSSTPLSPFTKRIPIQSFRDSTARKHSQSLNGKFSSVHLCHSSLTDHGISDVITIGLIQSTRPQTYFFYQWFNFILHMNSFAAFPSRLRCSTFKWLKISSKYANLVNTFSSSPLVFGWVQKPGHFLHIFPRNPNPSSSCAL